MQSPFVRALASALAAVLTPPRVRGWKPSARSERGQVVVL